MPLEIVAIPCLRDNYAYLVREPGTGKVVLIDAPEAAPIQAALDARGWTLAAILVTHHHDDHIAGVGALRARSGAEVVGAAADRVRLPKLDRAVTEGDTEVLEDFEVRVLDVPGHTVGHIAFHLPQARALFSADSLMVMGCGRLFEGAPEMMWASLRKLGALPDDTLVYSGHEYTESNMRFALTIDAANPALRERAEDVARARAHGEPTVPARLDLERATNPFLRAGDPGIKAALGMSDASDAEAFAEIRRRKDNF